MGNTGIHIAIPAAAPAHVIAGKLKFPLGLPIAGSTGANLLLMYSYVAKYIAEPGPSLANIAKEPLNTDRTPPSLYNCRTISAPLLYFDFCPGANYSWPCICSRTLTRLNGAVMSVMEWQRRIQLLRFGRPIVNRSR